MVTRVQASLQAWAVQVVFCSDELIDALLHTRAQHYLEFKLLQGRSVGVTQLVPMGLR